MRKSSYRPIAIHIHVNTYMNVHIVYIYMYMYTCSICRIYINAELKSAFGTTPKEMLAARRGAAEVRASGAGIDLPGTRRAAFQRFLEWCSSRYTI